jgi:hypothetical protein
MRTTPSVASRNAAVSTPASVMGTSLNDYEINIASIIIGVGLELTLTVSRKGAMMDNYDQVANPNLIPCFEF